MASVCSVVVKRTISQTIVPYKDVEERILLKRSKSRTARLGFSSTNNVSMEDAKKSQKSLGIERSRSEICLRERKPRETTLDVLESNREGQVKHFTRRREANKANISRPHSDFFPQFSIEKKNVGNKLHGAGTEVKKAEVQRDSAEKRLGRCIAKLKEEMMSLRKQDQELLKQLTSLNEHIQDLKKITRTQGNIYGSDLQEYNDLPSTKPVSPSVSILGDPFSRIAKNLGRKQWEKNGEKVEDAEITKSESSGKKIKNGGKGLQETSFEYIELPCDTSTPKENRSKATTKRSQSTKIGNISRKRVSSLRMERKSLSCQFLDSGIDNKGKKKGNGEFHVKCAVMHPKQSRPLSLIDTENLKDTNAQNTKRRSLSLSQLRPATKITEGSTSDSECSTSGCYGGSSTGSEVELERSYVRFDSEVLVQNSLNLTPLGRRHLALDTQGKFRKKIVSV